MIIFEVVNDIDEMVDVIELVLVELECVVE